MISTDSFTGLYHLLGDVKRELEIYRQVAQVRRFGPWMLRRNRFYATPAWCELFGISDPPETLEEYLARIDDKQDREQVRRDLLTGIRIFSPGTRWSGTFHLAGRSVCSTVFLTKSNLLIGVDTVVKF